MGDLSVGSRGSRVSIDGLGSSSGSASDSEVESVGEVEESEDRQRAPLGVGVNQNFDLRKSVNFDIQKELISKGEFFHFEYWKFFIVEIFLRAKNNQF